MNRKDDKAVRRCAASLSSLVARSEGEALSSDRQRALRDDAVSSLRQFNDEALLRTMHQLYQAGAVDARKHTTRKSGVRKRRPAERPQIVPASRGMAREALWLVTAVLAGAVVMSMEIVAFRLYAPYLGYSIYVWGTMISVVMAALALGYAFGGWLADRSRTDLPLYAFILGSAMYQLVLVVTARSLLSALSTFGDFSGTVLATVIIFVPPMAGLAIVGPYVIRLLSRAGRAGSTAGKVYALSTVGSIGGILLTSFVLVPRWGTQTALVIACTVSALLGVAGLIKWKRRVLLALAPVAALPFCPDATWGDNTVWVTESAYNLVRVVREGTQLALILNDEHSVATRLEERTGWTGGYYDDFSLGPLLVPAKRALVLGMGAGGSIRSMRATAPAVEIDAVEIDPEVVEAAYRYFGVRRDDARLRIHVADARPWIARDTGLYDIIHVDLYQGGPYIPFYLNTVEFFRSVRARMAEDGLLMINVVDAGPDRELLSSTTATLKRVFRSVAVFSRKTGNHMILAFAREHSIDSIRDSLMGARAEDHIAQHARLVASAVVDFVPPPDTTIFTDNHAPIEEMTRRMLASIASGYISD